MFLYFPLHSIECHVAYSFFKKVFDLYIGVLIVDGTVESPSLSFFFFQILQVISMHGSRWEALI